MSNRVVSLTKTQQSPPRKISLTKIQNTSREKSEGGVIGWECTPPQRGDPYRIFLYDGMVLRTSPVQEIEKASDALILKTLNSIYQVVYKGEDPRPNKSP